MRYIFIPLCVVSLLLSGCNKDGASIEKQEEENTFLQQGKSYMENSDYENAEIAFKQAIEDNPVMPTPYFDLATIYQQYKPDAIKAIFYYTHFAEMLPESERAKFAKEQASAIQKKIQQKVLELAGVNRIKYERDRLKLENKELYKMIAKLRKDVKAAKESQPTNPLTATAPAIGSSKQPTTSGFTQPVASGKSLIYTVVAGDTLSKISKKHYGNSSYWDVIYDANRSQMKSASDLRVGQSLVIPKK